MNLQWWHWLLMLGATFRLTRLVVEDTLLQPFRSWVEDKEVPPGGFIPPISFTTLINCSWCTGMWVSVLVFGATVLAPDVTTYIWAPLCISMAVGWEALLREKLEVG